ncbi:MAG: S1 RNA-binding domain-containing protein [Eubacterium sp.]|nr:S1 RNA-binding domain-containing protein [Eubacterium sp.]
MSEFETMDDYKEELNASFQKVEEGDILKGTVIAVDEKEVTLDLKMYASGIIKASEISSAPNFLLKESIHVGDEVEATVISVDDGSGNIQLSMKEATETLAWNTLAQYMEEGKVLTVKIGGIVPSGVITYVEGIRGFIPASHLCLKYVEDTTPWLGKTIEAKVITVDQSAKKLVLSGKEAEKEKKAEERTHQIAMLVPGTVFHGVVETLMPYGAFIQLENGLSGLVHISQISLKRIKKPSEVLEVGQQVKVKLLNTNNGKLSLSMKALEEEIAQKEEYDSPKEYVSHESASTSLGDLLANIKL